MRREVPIGVGLPLMGISWALLWTQDTFWNPLFFMGMWSGATLVMYGLGEGGYPGWRRHLTLLALSIPLWWWFELVNARVGNWEYLGAEDRYARWQYALMSTAAFSTVIPALDAAWGLTVRGRRQVASPVVSSMASWLGSHRGRYGIQIGLGMLFQGLVFAWPTVFYPFIWVAPFLMIDGLVAYRGGQSLVDDMMRRRWRLAVGVAMGGLLCGFLWEFWNFWATPRWIYHVPLLDFGKIFEMPILGYGGYIPFAWSIYQLLKLRLGRAGRALHPQIGERRCDGLPAHVLRQALGKGSKMPPHQVATLGDSLATTIDTLVLRVSGQGTLLRLAQDRLCTHNKRLFHWASEWSSQAQGERQGVPCTHK